MTASTPLVADDQPSLSRSRLPTAGPGLWVGGAILLLTVLLAIFAPLLAPHSPYAQSLAERLIKPVFMGGTWDHPLGTDHLGRDVLSRLIYGSRMSLAVGFGTILISAVLGIGLGLAAGFRGGRTDAFVVFLLTVRLSLPIMLAAIALVGLLGNSLGLMMLILAFFLWDQFLVVSRALAMRLKNAEFVLAARAAGFSDFHIIVREVLPNMTGPLVIVATLEMAHAIMLESALSFLGLGIRPPAASWGLMIAEAKDFVYFEAWLVNIPGFAIFTLVAGITLFGEGLRTVFENAGGR
ncbi:ABC transporter permease [Sinorhizobium medicae]|uniref:Peptide ABC transporter permease n=1 Tax=Sinorhizobium medicae TaxID=110321 RepID=A0A508X8G5_9HYPH|nr:ABC transporter permease [Sinorhizobium medicae]MDX0457176.1 ABC transporter permease subunit [Sinorhizobium medicae]MDX0500282.1 ABC transporter permease subunit [Sinorhizobium medicae]MDX0506033.1 ABC transporter permease subunit [Sinorhizobium medicae]MDX0523553.1 ABC transporter permease subunit [Sinorhizobium medicae]MDX0551658.1 ABC transporter permease subunit [Sinorhizobium medicae]